MHNSTPKWPNHFKSRINGGKINVHNQVEGNKPGFDRIAIKLSEKLLEFRGNLFLVNLQKIHIKIFIINSHQHQKQRIQSLSKISLKRKRQRKMVF